MRATEILTDEHRIIEQVLGCLERIADDASATDRIDVLSARNAAAFLRVFAVGSHHGKEESRLFAAIERCGLPADTGPTAALRDAHREIRGQVHRVELAVTAWEEGVAGGAPRFVFEARECVRLLRRNIANEERVLFPLADRVLAPEAQEDLLREFREADERDMDEDTRRRLVDIASSLAGSWGVTQARRCAPASFCSHALHAEGATRM